MGLGFLGMVAFTFGGTAIFKRLLAARLFNRSGSLIPYMEQERLPRRLLNLENARTYHQAKLASDDFVICGFDAAHHRFLLEGVRHRYVLNAVDVVKYFPLESGNVASVQLETNVLGELVPLVLSIENPFAQLGFSKDRIIKGLTRDMSTVLATAEGRGLGGTGSP
jgi:hypothetical protein